MSDFPEKMLQDIWARERAHALTPRCNGGFPIGDDHVRYHSRACDEATAALQEAIERARAEQDKAVAAERERCAGIADDAAAAYMHPIGTYDKASMNTAAGIARAIRARTLEGKENSDGS